MAIKEKNFKLPMSGWFLLAFTVVALLSLIVNIDLIPKPSKNFGRLKYFIFGVGGIFVLRAWVKEASDKTKKIILNTFFFSIIAAGAFASIKFFVTGEDRARGFTDTLRYGYGSSMILIVILGSILHKGKMGKWFNVRFALGALIVGFIGLYLTYNRGSLFAFLCGLPVLLYFYKPKLGLTIGGLAGIAVFGLILNYLFGSTAYNSRFLVNKNNPSDHIRRSQWQAAIIAIKEKPVIGWGLSNFHSQLKRIKLENDLDAKDYNDAHAHNLFLEVGAGTGLIGLIIFIAWIISWGIEVMKSGGLSRALILPFGIVFVVGSQFEVTFDANNASMIFFIYSLGSCLALDSQKQV